MTKSTLLAICTIAYTIGTPLSAQIEGCEFGLPPLHTAALNNDIETIQALLIAGQNIDQQEKSCGGVTPLIAATWKGHHQAMKLLLAKGANPNAKGGQHRNAGIIRTYFQWGKESDLESYPPSDWTALFYAVYQDDIKAIQALLTAGANVNVTADYDGGTALMIATTNKPIQTLLTAGADVNAKDLLGNTALHYAAQNGNTEAIQALVAGGANINAVSRVHKTPLQVAGDRNQVEAIKALASQGAITRKSLHAAAAENDITSLTFELAQPDADVNARDDDGDTPLHVAIRQGHTEAIQALVAGGADVNARDDGGDTPLYTAAWQGHTEAIQALVAGGADVNARDDGGDTPLHYAAWQGHTEAIQALVARGAEVNTKNEGDRTPLYHAIRHGHTQAIQALIAHAAWVNTKDKSGRTPLHVAIRQGHTEAIQALVADGARVNARDGNGETPLDLAAEYGYTEALQLLRKANAKQAQK